ncbi:MAG: anaerobic ribonucleoside-triphosphate reductase activating protein [Bacillota bacterium]|nr:anaerobic ribonucleoside-triphosphate reductase activating protein [Bacillota bacterium]
MNIQIAELVNDSIVDGKGLRLSIYVQGCSHHCKGCHNPQTHDPRGGKTMAIEEIWALAQKNPLIDGLTFSGGEPMEQPIPLIALARKAKDAGMGIWCYTGYTWEELVNSDDDRKELLGLVDVLVEGPFKLEERTLSMAFKGSKNQRIIDVPQSLAKGKIVLFME